MKITRHDAQEFEAVQSSLGQVIVGGIVTAVGLVLTGAMIARPSGVITENAGIGIGAGLVLAGFGAIIMLTARNIHLTADSGAKTLTVTFRSLISKKELGTPFGDVVRIGEASSIMGPDGGDQTLHLALKDGSNLTLPLSKTTFRINGIPLGAFGRHHDIGQELATYMNVPFEALGFGSVTAVQNTMAEIVGGAKEAAAANATISNLPASAPVVERVAPPMPAAPAMPPAAPAESTPAPASQPVSVAVVSK